MSAGRPSHPRRAAVIGWPVSHSLSPLIHRTWAAREGIDARYEAVAVEPSDDALRIRIDELRRDGLAGVNVTIPHKERALAIATKATPAARAIGAANMLTFIDDDILAANSDADAVEAIIRNLARRPRAALVLGAGGAARAILHALRAAGVATIRIANRTRARADAIAGDAEIFDWNARSEALNASDFVINATSLGMTGAAPLDIDLGELPGGAVVFDTVYSPLETPLLKAAKARGHETIDGLEMLMRQAVPAYLAWLGSSAVVDADLRARLEAALRERSR